MSINDEIKAIVSRAKERCPHGDEVLTAKGVTMDDLFKSAMPLLFLMGKSGVTRIQIDYENEKARFEIN